MGTAIQRQRNQHDGAFFRFDITNDRLFFTDFAASRVWQIFKVHKKSLLCLKTFIFESL